MREKASTKMTSILASSLEYGYTATTVADACPLSLRDGKARAKPSQGNLSYHWPSPLWEILVAGFLEGSRERVVIFSEFWLVDREGQRGGFIFGGGCRDIWISEVSEAIGNFSCPWALVTLQMLRDTLLH